MAAPITPKVSSGKRMALRWNPRAGPPAPAASKDVNPSATRTPLSPTAATQMLSAVASTSEPQANSRRAGLDGDFSESDGFTFAYPK